MARTTSTPLTPIEAPPLRLPTVIRTPRLTSALHPTALTADPDVLGLNLTRGCVHRCAFCSVRGSPYYGGDSEVLLYDDSIARIEAELDSRRSLPRAIIVSPATDPFPPIVEVQKETARVVTTLAERGVETWLMTRGHIRPEALAVLEAHHLRVKVTVSLTTCDRALQRLLEPWSASPRLRLKQIASLRQREIPVQVALDPLVPGVTDTRKNLNDVLEAVASAGVRHVTASYLFLREGIARQLTPALTTLGVDGVVLKAFADGPVLAAPGLSAARYLPRARRQRGYGMLISIAAEHGVTVSVCGHTNPDFGSPRSAASPTSPPRMFPLLLSSALAEEG